MSINRTESQLGPKKALGFSARMLLIHHVTWSYFRWPRCLPEPPTFEKSKRIPFIRRRDGRLKLEGIHFVLFFGIVVVLFVFFFIFYFGALVLDSALLWAAMALPMLMAAVSTVVATERINSQAMDESTRTSGSTKPTVGMFFDGTLWN